MLISPLLSMRETLALHAQERGVPGFAIPPLLATTRWLCSLRAGLDLDELEHLDLLDQLPRTPMLITHGDADRLVPVEPSRALADARPDQVVYEEYAGAGHTREWNADPGRFSSDLHDFLATRVQDASP